MAFTVEIPDKVIDASIDCCNAGNMGNRGDGSDGSKDQQLTGIIGQNMLNLALKHPLMKAGGGFDGGIDAHIYDVSFDIKTMGRTVTPRLNFVNNLTRSQVKFNVDAYLFASVNRNENKLTVCGWLPKTLFLERANLFIKGVDRKREDGSVFKTKSDMYEITNSDLFYEATSWEKLFTTIKHFAENRDHPKYQTMKQWLADYEKDEK